LRHSRAEERLARPKVGRSRRAAQEREEGVAELIGISASRQVSEEEGKELANQLKCAWVETSARHDVNVGECFHICLSAQCTAETVSKSLLDKVFDLILGETERDTVEGGPEPPASKCVIC
jgi:Ras family protein